MNSPDTEDRHITTARELLKHEGLNYDDLPEEQQKEWRARAKSTNFALNRTLTPLGPEAAKQYVTAEQAAASAIRQATCDYAKQDTSRTDELYNSQERERMIAAMKSASNDFYRHATHIGCHAFIEFCGLMNEFIKMCETAHKSGHDFNLSNIHCGHSLPLESYMASYIGEKLGCIYGTSLKDPELFLTLVAQLKLPYDVKVVQDHEGVYGLARELSEEKGEERGT